MTQLTSVGTLIKLSAGSPATHDAAGFAALTFTTLGEGTASQEIGRKYNTAKHVPLATGATHKIKTSFDAGAITIKGACDTDDAGQILAKTALGSSANYAFQIHYPNGDKTYFLGLVTAFDTGANDASGIRSFTMTVEVNPSTAGADFVESLAP